MAASVSEEAQKWSSDKYSLFFYGTLLHPAVLKRVLGREGSGLFHQPAVLYVSLYEYECGSKYSYSPLDRSDITLVLYSLADDDCRSIEL